MTKRDSLWKYAPVWAVLFATGATVAKSVGTHYILRREWNFKLGDAATAFGGAVLGYVAFRARYGNKDESNPLTR